MPELVRAFVAVQTPDPVRDLIAATRTRIDPFLHGAFRWTARESLHTTLYFIGEAPEETVAAVQRGLSEVDLTSISLVTERLTVFPDLRQPRVLVLALLDTSGSLARLQGAVHRVCYPVSPNKESKPFRAHVTIARLRNGAMVDQPMLKTGLESCRPKPTAFEVSSFELVRSVLSASGPAYETLARYGVRAP